jgi:hypothetical protein
MMQYELGGVSMMSASSGTNSTLSNSLLVVPSGVEQLRFDLDQPRCVEVRGLHGEGRWLLKVTKQRSVQIT